MIEIEAIGNEVLAILFAAFVVFALTLAWKSTGRRPLHYEIFLAELHQSLRSGRRYVYVLQLDQSLNPGLPWGEILPRMRSLIRRDNPEDADANYAISETSVVIRTPSSSYDAATGDGASTLRAAAIGDGSNSLSLSPTDRELAVAVAIAVIGRRFPRNAPPRRQLSGVVQTLEPGSSTIGLEGRTVSEGNSANATSEQQNNRDSEQSHSREVTRNDVTVTVSVLSDVTGESRNSLDSEIASLEQSGEANDDSVIIEIPLRTRRSTTGTEDESEYSEYSPLSSTGGESSANSSDSEGSATTEAALASSDDGSQSTGTTPDVSAVPATATISAPVAIPESNFDSTLRLKFLDDTVKETPCSLSTTVSDFIKAQFPVDVAAGKTVRLIFQGQLLRDDVRSLESYGVRDGSVVHCHISNKPYARMQNGAPVVNNDRQSQPSNGHIIDTAARNRQEYNRDHPYSVFNVLMALVYASAWTSFSTFFRRLHAEAASRVITGRAPTTAASTDTQQETRQTGQQTPSRTGLRATASRVYRYFHNAVFGAYMNDAADGEGGIEEAAARTERAARQPLPESLMLGNYLFYIFAAQFIAVWAFVWSFPQVCDNTAIGLLVLLTLYFIFVVCRNFPTTVAQRPRSNSDAPQPQTVR